MALRPDQIAALEALRNRPTLYEAVVIRPDGERRLLTYCGRHSMRGLRDALSERGAAVATFLGVGDNAEAVVRGREVRITGGGIVRFSGRTKRDVIMQDTKLTYIGGEG